MDVLLMPNNATESIDALEKAVGSGELTRDRLIESAARIVATARHQAIAQPATSSVGSHEAQAVKLASASITQLGGRCNAPMVGRSVRLDGGSAKDRAALTNQLAKHGVRVGNSGDRISLLSGGEYNAGKASAEGGSEANSAGAQGASATDAKVLIALDTPYVLAQRRSGAIGLATYGDTPATFEALAKIIAGKEKASGTLPVPVGSDKVGAGACG